MVNKLKRYQYSLIALLAVLFTATGCVENGGDGTSPSGNSGYGSWQFGDESVPVNMVRTYDAAQFLVLLSPLTDETNVTTSVIIGLKHELLGMDVDVEYKFHNDDYVFVYEDPQYYYSQHTPLESGTIYIQQIGDSRVSVDVDVVLQGGKPFRYSNQNLPMQ